MLSLSKHPRQHRPQRSPAEQVNVEVRNFLVTMRADVGEQAIAGGDQAVVARNLPDRAHEPGDFFR